jgi:hypothetical protein
VFLYQKSVIGRDENDPTIQRVKWKSIRRMEFMKNLYGNPNYLGFVNDDFTAYVDLKKVR